jgi:hypothetical protein
MAYRDRVVRDVDHRSSRVAEAFEQGCGLPERRLHVDQLHDAFAIGLLAVMRTSALLDIGAGSEVIPVRARSVGLAIRLLLHVLSVFAEV